MMFDSIKYDNQLITKKYGRIKSIEQVYCHPEGKKVTEYFMEGKKKRQRTYIKYPPPVKFTVIKT
jgi:hypothetical protein